MKNVSSTPLPSQMGTAMLSFEVSERLSLRIFIDSKDSTQNSDLEYKLALVSDGRRQGFEMVDPIKLEEPEAALVWVCFSGTAKKMKYTYVDGEEAFVRELRSRGEVVLPSSGFWPDEIRLPSFL